MKKIYLILAILISNFIASETIFDVTTIDEEVITGYILEDTPGESVVIETLDGDIEVISYKDLLLIRPRVEKNKEKLDEKEEEPLLQEKVEEALEEGVKTEDLKTAKAPSYNIDDLSFKLKNIALFSLYDLDFDEETLRNTDIEIRYIAYENSKKSEVTNYTLLNMIPGLGSILQGDYYSAAYTIGSIAVAMAYNLGDGFGTDYYFAINLNGIIAYTVSFFAPYRFNNSYNSLLKEKLEIE